MSVIPLYIPIVNWIAAFVFASFATVMLLGTKHASTRAYAAVAYCAAGWALGLGAYFFSTSPRWMVFWNEWNHLLAGLIGVAFFYFALLFPNEKMPRRFLLPATFLLELGFLYAYFFTDVIILDSGFLERESLDRYRDLFFSVGPLFYSHFFVFLFAGFVILYRKMKREKDADLRHRLAYILFGTTIGVVPPILTDIILPYLGFYDLYWTAGILTLGWVVFISYSIAKHHLFNARLVVTAIASTAIILIAGLLFTDIFLGGEFEFGLAGRTGIFTVFAAVGSFLIAGIVRAERQREELKRLSMELTGLNTRLKQRVEKRTRDLKKESVEGETIIENLADALVEYDEFFSILRMNRAAEELFGIPRGRVIGRAIRPEDIQDPTLESLVVATYPILSVEPKTETVETVRAETGAILNEVITRHPYERELEVATVTVRAEGAPDRTVKVIRDITKEKAVSREKSEFITIAGHRLRTPLSVIKWTFSLMLEGDAGRLGAKQKAAIERANATNEEMIRLVNDLLNTAHIEEGQFGYEIAENDLAALITEMFPEFEALAKKKGVVLSFDRGTRAHPLYFDREKLSLALRNLIENAINYTPEDGTVSVGISEDADDAIVTVSDSGIGIPGEERARLFTKFFRGSNAKKIRSEGTGLGLFIVKNIVARHGGAVAVESVVQRGSTFTVRLPKKPERIPEYGNR